MSGFCCLGDMMPIQPLSRVKRDARVKFLPPDAMGERPEVAIEVAKGVAKWSQVECLLGVALAVVLETEAQTGLAMFLALTSSSNQITVFDAAVQAKLTKADKELVSATMMIVRATAKERHRIAHWCYAISHDLPKDLLIIDPHDLAPLYASVLGYHDPTVEVDKDKVYVLRAKDAQEISSKINDLRDLIDRMIHFLAIVDRGERAERRLQLSSEPPLAEALRQLRERQKNTRKAPKSLPRRGRRVRP
jgi:hypothetical protein